MPALVWFRSDLRTSDNTALWNAAQKSTDGIIGVFVISPGEWRAHDWAPVRVDFTLRTLKHLSESLASVRIPLLIVQAPSPQDVVPAVLAVAKRHGCESIHFNREYELNEARRDAALEAAANKVGTQTIGYTDQVILPPDLLRTGEGRFYTVFSPFKRSWIKKVLADGIPPVLARPAPQRPLATASDSVPESLPGFTSPVPAARWPAGEAEAQRRLSTFVSSKIESYKEERDLPSHEGTSQLSPYLAVGAISPRQCLAAAIDANPNQASPLDSGPQGTTTWISELIWREFYVAVMVGFPRVCMHRAFQPATERIRWNDNTEHFERWKAGQTGVPIVDAGMRQLLAEGWMHNRVRMIVAMYLSKNLFLDWRLGEKHFMQNLVDGFLACNNGGWQWSASTGTDAAPYFRIFNPISQSKRFDEAGTYIRRWVPELANIEGEAVHDPSELPMLLRSTIDYPEMLVDLAASRNAAIQAFKVGS